MRKAMLSILALVCVLSTASLIWAQAQVPAARGQAPAAAGQAAQGRGTPYRGKPMPGKMEGTFTVYRGGELQSVLNQTGGDTPLRVASAPSGNYGAYILTYQPTAAQPGANVNGTYHSEVAEIYYVINGSGTAMLGGELENATENDPESNGVKNVTGPSAGGVLKGATAVRFTPGTIFIVPPGVPHQAAYDILTKTDYLIIRVDPKKTIIPH